MNKQEYIKRAVEEAEIKWDKIQKADNYKNVLKNIIKNLKEDGFKLVIIGNDIRITF